MLEKIRIENYRSCLHTAFDCHPTLSILIGPNSSGKTNVLQAIMLLNKIAEESHRGDEYHKDDISLKSRIKAVFSQGGINTRLNASVVAYTDESNNDIILSSRQKWSLTTSTGKKIEFELPLSALSSVGQYLQYFPDMRMESSHALQGSLFHHFGFHSTESFSRLTKEQLKWIVQSLNRAAHFFEGIRYYGASQFTNPGACPVSFEIEKGKRRSRIVRPRGHAKVLYQMYTAEKTDQRYKQFISIVGPMGLRLIDQIKFQEVPTSSTDYSVRVGGKLDVRRRDKILIIPRFKIGKQWLSPNQLSEGTFKTLSLLFHLITEESTVLLIEEPEVCVHHGLLSSILELIKTYSKQKQIIVSTHSDYVLDHVVPANVFKVTFDRASGTVVRHIQKAMTTREYAALRDYLDKVGNLGEFWREGGLGDRR